MIGVTQVRRRTVIVENSRTMQAIAEAAFEKRPDFEVVGVAGDVLSGAGMVRRLAPDLVTFGLSMPGVDGAGLIELTEGVKGLCRVVVSDHAAKDVVLCNKLEALGASLCLSKRELTDAPAAFFRKINLACDRIVAEGRQASVSCETSERGSRAGGRVQSASVAHFGFPVPVDEDQRIAALSRKRLSNAEREKLFDLVTDYVADVTEFPVCLLTFIDRDTQWIKSSFGYDRGSVARADAFCNYAIASRQVFVVQDAEKDRRFANNPLVVGEPHIRTYAGQPIASADGIQLGALCVIDTKVRPVTPAVLRQLATVAEILAEVLENRPELDS